MSNIGRISSGELRDLLLSLLALVIGFSILGERRMPGLEMVLVSTAGVGSGFLLHEMAHKFVAQRFGYFAEYRANRMGLVLIVLMAFAGFIFAAPGAVMISRPQAPKGFYWQDSAGLEELERQGKLEELWISLAGPMTNIVLVFVFLALLLSGIAQGGLLAGAVSFALFINLTLAAFNLLPFGPLDGKKIYDANRLVWAVVGGPTILAALAVYTGFLA